MTKRLNTGKLATERLNASEGVGAGGLALLWQLAGRQPGALAEACDAACRLELGA